MDAPVSDADRVNLLNDLAVLAEHAARPPDAPLTDAASKAVARLYQRYKRRVYHYCIRRIRFSLPYGTSLDDFVTDLFFRFIRSAHRLKLMNRHSFSDVERQLLHSFHQHATWQIGDWIDRHRKVAELLDVLLQDMAGRRKPSDIPQSADLVAKKARLEKVLADFDDRTRDVLLTSYGHRNLTTKEFELPEDVAADLCRRCNFNNGNALVKFRSRKIEELRALLLSVA